MNRRSQIPVAISVCLALALPLVAQTSRIYRDKNCWVEEITGVLPAAKNLQVSLQSGSVEVEGGQQRNITYSIKKRVYLNSEADARRLFEAFHIKAVRNGDTAVIEGVRESGSLPRFSADFAIQTPQQLASASVETDGGNITVNGLKGRVHASSGGGNLQISKVSGPVKAETSGGSLQLNDTPGALTLRTGGGGIRISGESGPLDVQSGGGNIVVASSRSALLKTQGGSIAVEQASSRLLASTDGGSIDVGEVEGSATLETGGGSIRLRGAKGPVFARTSAGAIELYKLMQGARAETGAGGLIAEFLGAEPGASRLETGDGDVVIYLAPKVRFTVRAVIEMANGHQIRSEFSQLKVNSQGSSWGPQTLYAEGVLNGGGPVLQVRTVSGNIEFRHAGAH